MASIPRARSRLTAAELEAMICARRGELEALESDVARIAGAPHAVLVPSARAGLELVLRAMHAPRGSEVVLSALGFAPLLDGIRRAGLEPRLADVALGSLHASSAAIDAACTSRTVAIVATHAYGRPAPLVRDVADRRALLVVEDAAQALGGAGVGAQGDATLFSFGPTKPLGAWGGGMVVCRDAQLADRVRAARTPAWGSALRLCRGAILDASTRPLVHPVAARVARALPMLRRVLDRPSSGPWHRAPVSASLAALVRARLRDLDARTEKRRALHRALAIGSVWPDAAGGIGWGLLVDTRDARRAASAARAWGVDAIAAELDDLGAAHASVVARTLVRLPLLEDAVPAELALLARVAQQVVE